MNYLHPDLKREKMTPQEERLVIELHSRWGNRFASLILIHIVILINQVSSRHQSGSLQLYTSNDAVDPGG